MIRSRPLVPLVLVLAAAPLSGRADVHPIREITLYRSGVGAFERAAPVTGDATVRLRFPTDAVNDILKSMTVVDLGGGTIGPVTYGSKEPLARRLASFGVDLSRAPSIPDLLRQLRGARLRAVTIDGPLEGTILGVEERSVPVAADGGAAVVARPHLNLLTGRGVRSTDVASLASFELLDPALAEELRLALAALADERAERVKSVDLSFHAAPDETRTVVVTYVREMPVWKTSYRLILPDGDGRPTMQGWAIVENTTDDAWDGVRLSLASGRPVGFTMDLYQPIHAARPEVPVPLDAGLAPALYESGGRPVPEKQARLQDQAKAPSGPARSGGAAFLTGLGSRKRDAWGAGDDLAVDADALGEAHAAGGEVGAQFHYTVDAPVHLDRQRSAMLPILRAEIDGRRLAILTLDGSGAAPEHPMQGVELTNDTELHLMPGPIAVYDAGAYAGDARIDHTARNQKRLLSFAMDVDVESRTRATSEQTLVALKIVDGALVRRSRATRERTIELVNHDDARARTVLIEAPKDPAWDRVAPADPTEETSTFARFEVPLDASGRATFVLTEERIGETRLAVTSMSTETLLDLRADGLVSDAVVEAIRTAASLESEAARARDTLARLDRERTAIAVEQERIRSNMARVAAGTDLHRRYVAKLSAQEDRLEAIANEREEAEEARRTAEERRDEFVRGLEVE
ncbi:MAG: hypothetical protein ACF8XB_16135 [Planctomycetota bacterium JB042]